MHFFVSSRPFSDREARRRNVDMLIAETMIQQQPPTPGGSSELEYGLHHLVQHNASASFQHGMEGYLHARQPSGYGSPGQMQYPDLHDPAEVGLGIQFVRRKDYAHCDQADSEAGRTRRPRTCLL